MQIITSNFRQFFILNILNTLKFVHQLRCQILVKVYVNGHT